MCLHLLSVTMRKWLLWSGNEATGMFKWEKKDSQRASLTPSKSLRETGPGKIRWESVLQF